MIYAHSIGRGVRYYPERPAIRVGEDCLTFRELYTQVKGLAAALNRRGFRTGDRLALLLPNGPEYVELVYACSLLGVIIVPLNIRLSAVEIDRVLADACPRGLLRYSSLPTPSSHFPCELVLDEEPLEEQP